MADKYKGPSYVKIDRILQRAKHLWNEEGHLEIDIPKAPKSLYESISLPYGKTVEENGGVYVQAWLWVPYEDVKDVL